MLGNLALGSSLFLGLIAALGVTAQEHSRGQSGGEGFVDVTRQIDADHYEELARVPSERGAKTALLVPELRRLYVAVGGSDKNKAGLLRYEVVPDKAE